MRIKRRAITLRRLGTAIALGLFVLGAATIGAGAGTGQSPAQLAAPPPQKTAAVEAALSRIREVGFPTLNIDLIYGLPGQTVGSWLRLLNAALRFAPCATVACRRLTSWAR